LTPELLFLLLYLIFGFIPGMLLEIYLHVAIMFAGGSAEFEQEHDRNP